MGVNPSQAKTLRLRLHYHTEEVDILLWESLTL